MRSLRAKILLLDYNIYKYAGMLLKINIIIYVVRLHS